MNDRGPDRGGAGVVNDRSFRILVVDDHHDSANTIATILKLLGNEVSTANDGIQAVELARRLHPELILMDIGMPKLSGYEATQLIRREPSGAETVIIALSGRADEEDRARSKAAGCDGHLLKPVQMSDLETLLGALRAGSLSPQARP